MQVGLATQSSVTLLDANSVRISDERDLNGQESKLGVRMGAQDVSIFATTKRERNSVKSAGRPKAKPYRFVFLGSVLAFVLMVAGCGWPESEPVTDAEIYGTWISRGPDGHTATLIFAEDGTFQGTDIPGGTLRAPGDGNSPDGADWKNLTERHGTWTTKWNPRAELASIVLKTQFVSGETIEVFGSGQGKTLTRFIGDPDSWITLVFERADRPGVEATAPPG